MDTINRARSGMLPSESEFIVFMEFFTNDGGNECLRLKAVLVKDEDMSVIGGADIMPNPHRPLFTFYPHAIEFEKKGLVLAISTAMLGAAGPIVGSCYNAKGEIGLFELRREISSKIDLIFDAAAQAAWDQVKDIADL